MSLQTSQNLFPTLQIFASPRIVRQTPGFYYHVKGHRELYTAASAHLDERYSIHPDAEQQGIFLAIWFAGNEKVAGRKRHSITSAQELKSSIESRLPQELTGLVDVFVLDVSKLNRSISHNI